jgi:hypothetical protein
MKSGLLLLLSSLILPIAIGSTFAIGYIFILNRLGIELTKKELDEEEEDESENKKDYICASYKGSNFVNITST